MHVLVLVAASLIAAVPQPLQTALPVVKAVSFDSGPASPATPRGPGGVVGGKEAVGWIELSAPAVCVIHCDSTYVNGKSAGGMNVSVSSSNPSVAKLPVPGIIFFHVGDTREKLTVITTGVSVSTNVTISAWREGSPAQSATLQVLPPALTGFTIDAASVVGGSTAHGTLTFNGTAAAGAIVVKLSSSSPSAVQVPQTVSLDAGKTTATFDIKTAGVPTDVPITVTATLNDEKKSATLTLTAAVLKTLDRSTVTLTGVAPAAGAVIALKSADPEHASVPGSVTIAPGADHASINLTDHPDYAGRHNVKISATFNGVTKTYDELVPKYIKPDLYIKVVKLQDRFGNEIAKPADSQPYKACVTFGAGGCCGWDIYLYPKTTTLHVAFMTPTGTGTSAGHEFDVPVVFNTGGTTGWTYQQYDEAHMWHDPPTCIDMPGLTQSGAYTDLTLVVNPGHNNPDESNYGNNTHKQRITRQ